MSFTKNNQSNIENSEENNSETSGLIGKIMPYIPLILEDFTGQKMRMGGTIGDILSCLQRLEKKFDDFAKNTEEQFIHQEKQISTLLTNAQSLTDFRHSLEGKEIKFIKN